MFADFENLQKEPFQDRIMSVSKETDDPWRIFTLKKSGSHSAKIFLNNNQEMTTVVQQKNDLCLVNNSICTFQKVMWIDLLNLRSLDLSSNNLTNLPDAMSMLNQLEVLNLSKNWLKMLPKVLRQLKSLKKLTLADNKLTEIEYLAPLSGLESLDLSCNKLIKFPKSLSNLTNLKHLNLSRNYLKTIPLCLRQGLNRLENLDVSENIKINLNSPVCSHQLRIFKAQNIKFCPAFPKWIFSGKFPILEEANFSHSQFKRVYIPQFPQKTMIRKLNFEMTHITIYELQKILVNVTGLEVLEISNADFKRYHSNLFRKWPLKFVTDPEKLIEVNISYLDLSIIPKTIKNFRNLKTIDLTLNRIKRLPEEICALEKLEVLIVCGNGLIKLPVGLGKITGLKVLRATNNRISALPENFREIKGLEVLDLYDNEFSEVPKVLGDCEKLKEFDIDMNFMDTDAIQMMKTPYTILRSNLRQSKNPFRSFGRKTESEYNTEAESWTTTLPSDCGYSSTDYLAEDWDVNFSDEFDSYNPLQSISKLAEFKCNLRPQFVPSDIHPRPILETICIARKMGDFTPIPEPVPGQFDDA